MISVSRMESARGIRGLSLSPADEEEEEFNVKIRRRISFQSRDIIMGLIQHQPEDR